MLLLTHVRPALPPLSLKVDRDGVGGLEGDGGGGCGVPVRYLARPRSEVGGLHGLDVELATLARQLVEEETRAIQN